MLSLKLSVVSHEAMKSRNFGCAQASSCGPHTDHKVTFPSGLVYRLVGERRSERNRKNRSSRQKREKRAEYAALRRNNYSVASPIFMTIFTLILFDFMHKTLHKYA